MRKLSILLLSLILLTGCSGEEYEYYYVHDGNAYKCKVLRDNLGTCTIKYNNGKKDVVEIVYESSVQQFKPSEIE